MSTASTLAAAGLEIPPGYSIVSYDERPDLDPAIDELLAATWPAFMLEDEVANAHFGRAYESWPALQTMLLDDTGRLVAIGNAMPLVWDGTDDGLPEGWREQVLQSVADTDAGNEMNTLGAMQIAMRGDLRGAGLSGTMVGAMRAAARACRLPGRHCLRPADREGPLPARPDRALCLLDARGRSPVRSVDSASCPARRAGSCGRHRGQ